ncbi:MAG: hypothetical protein ACREQD_07800, partial [Candidatus Binataceae bacterium]
GAGLKGGGEATTRLPAWFSRLSVGAQRIYLKSDAIDRFDFTPDAAAQELARSLMLALESGASSIVERRAQLLLDALCRQTALSPVQIQVRNVRPRDTRGELHGIFYPRGPGRRAANPYQYSTAATGGPLIILWMRTAQRHEVVKPKTFVRTLMHEFAHYLDYAMLRLGDSPHTSGFFKRESFLVRSLQIPASD